MLIPTTAEAITRRRLLGTSFLAGLSAAILPRLALSAEGEPIPLGTLTPLTGAGANYGGRMRDGVAGVVAAVNESGGILGRQIKLISEDDQTNPEAGVRAARKLIDVDKVVAIVGVWASSVTTAVAPLCWESGTALFCTSGADSITRLPHKGFIFRTEPGAELQSGQVTEFMLGEGAKRLAYMGPQTPFTKPSIQRMTDIATKAGAEVASVIYESEKASYRSEVDQIMASKPDFLMFGGYAPDTVVLIKDLYKAGYAGKAVGPSYVIDGEFLKTVPKEATEGVYVYYAATSNVAGAVDKLKSILKIDQLDAYTAQTYDHANLVLLALAAGKGEASGTVVRDNVRNVSQGGGEKVGFAVEGAKLLAEGKKINYEGASGPCEFNELGDITDVVTSFDVVKDGKIEKYK
jgi:branched-chain amino acid transport system substrate-binding protein